MNFLNKTKIRTLFVAALIILTFSLAACQKTPATEAPTATPEPTPTSAPTSALSTVTSITLDGAIVTDSGVQYLELVPGTGVLPKTGDIITLNYIASLPDGTELANTFTDGRSVTAVWGQGRLLPGWEEGIGLMKVGTRSKIVIPPDLAFGEEGTGIIPGNSQIVIEMELLSAAPAPTPTEVTADKLTTSDSGLQYYDIKVGSGDEAVNNSTVSNHYTIWVKTDAGYDYIDSSINDTALDFVVGRLDMVFPGWDEGITGMKVGGKRLLVIPPDLALGDQSSGTIPANATLIMEVELTNVAKPLVATKVDEKDYTTTETGLKYYDLVAGTGDTPTAGQTVVVHYTGWLVDGTQFDSSVASGQPFTFVLGQGNVIPGWDEGVSTMKVGGKRQLVIPPDLGYGDSGAGGVIPGGATLIFEVELLEIQP